VAWDLGSFMLASCDEENMINIWDTRIASLHKNILIKELVRPILTTSEETIKEQSIVFKVKFANKDYQTLFVSLRSGELFEIDWSKGIIVKKFNCKIGLKAFFTLDETTKILVSIDDQGFISFFRQEEAKTKELLRLKTNINFSFADPEPLNKNSNLKHLDIQPNRKITMHNKSSSAQKTSAAIFSPSTKKSYQPKVNHIKE
jgi:hypothetical protein